MAEHDLEIPLIEDRSADIELRLRAVRKGRLAKHIKVVKDGEDALDFLFCRGGYAGRSTVSPPKLILLDLKLPNSYIQKPVDFQQFRGAIQQLGYSGLVVNQPPPRSALEA